MTAAPHFWWYAVETTNQNAEAAITEARFNLEDRETARQFQAQNPLTASDRELCTAIDNRVRQAANAEGNVTCKIKLEVNDVSTPPLSEEALAGDQQP